MLTIQKASAGSGKTYALSRKFILNLIAYVNEKGQWQIRDERQIEDALQHILAITFTNKATNEMKERIVKNLSLLSLAKKENFDVRNISKIPYLREFQELTGASPQVIGRAAEFALKNILNNYSYFKISTIDSFFQEILRTFAYEANITNNYQLEIDSAFVSDNALDAAIHELDIHPEKMGHAVFWLNAIMREEAKKSQMWNPFNKGTSSQSVIGKIRNAIKQLENEEFKEIKELLYKYFDNTQKKDSLIKVYETLESKGLNERERLLDNIKRDARILMTIVNECDYPKGLLNQNFTKHLPVILSLKFDKKFDKKFESFFNEGSVFNKKYRTMNPELDRIAIRMYSNLKTWNEPAPDSFYKYFIVYGSLIPYLGLLLEIKEYLSQVLEDNHLIQLSETGYILKKIIGSDDTPFVYERLGNRIDNFLIDEFQDTSKMQWDILEPLISESESKGGDSLIIGDPKQSIYRFRNADHSLITEVVPSTYKNHLSLGESKEENTNWRSHSKIVKFNNFFFKKLSDIITGLSIEKGNSYNFNKLYSNVVQYPHNQEEKGYVEIRMICKPDKDRLSNEALDGDDDDEEYNKNWFTDEVLNNIGPLITSLIKRGYKQKDIGILVSKNEKGKQIIQSLISYNDSLNEDYEKIAFISEESLLISSSVAVNLILGVIQRLCQPLLLNEHKNVANEEETVEKLRYYNWNKIKTGYNIFAASHPDLTNVDSIEEFLNTDGHDDTLTKMLVSLPNPSLSSIVEATVKIFLSEELRISDAIYISSFQDVVNEYCQNHLDDPASFLEWWNIRGCKQSVKSPDNINAVRIMTIHKSKGLEFKCVIVPFASDSFVPSSQKEEWRWVKPHLIEELNMPPVLPVTTGSHLVGSYHETEYKKYFDQVFTDKLNLFYVAFTRACNELYIFTKNTTRKTNGISDFIKRILINETSQENLFSPEELLSVISSAEIEIKNQVGTETNLSQTVIRIGHQFSQEEISQEYDQVNLLENDRIYFFEDYYVNSTRPKLRSLATRVKPSGDSY